MTTPTGQDGSGAGGAETELTGAGGTGAERRYAEHTARLAAPAGRAYDLIADVRRWPLLFPPCLHAEVLEAGPGTERVRLWALAGDEIRSWTSRRTLDPASLRIGFRQEDSAPPLADMGGEWRFEAKSDGDGDGGDGTRLVLAHDWSMSSPGEEAHRWVTDALDRNSAAEIGAVTDWAQRAEAAGGAGELIFSFTDTLDIAAPAADVYAFLHRADLWPGRLPHVAGLDLDSAPAGPTTAGAEIQRMAMETRAADGTSHRTRSIRLCFTDELIVYKQTIVPPPLLGHAGAWTLTPTASGTRVTARHRVALDPDALAARFGPGATLRTAREKVRELLGGNSRHTLEHARAHTEATAGAGAVNAR
ncbi:aromatase/cyclase [Streptomyces sp. NPDC058653]|uniref:aromatase/cyclase n=1 Tax=Streptomyces sp. NPDC058653 TaxID=3346576 RepID=UPI003654FDEB